MISILRKIRLGAALLLICTFFLPLSECSRHDKSRAVAAHKSFSQKLFPQNNDDFVYQYPVGTLTFSSWKAGGVALLALGWALAFSIFDKKLMGRRFSWILYLVQLLLCAGTLYWLHLFTALGEWLYGAYLVCIAIAIYALTSFILFVAEIRSRRRARQKL